MGSSFDSIVVYDAEIIPPCKIQFSDDYWEWRLTQGISVERDKDMATLYRRYVEVSADGGSGLSVALCDAELLMSEELARVMNTVGNNASPITVYYQAVSRWSEGVRGPRILNIAEFENLISSSIEEVESRF